MKANKIDKPGKVYVVTKKTKAGSSGTASAAKKVSPCLIGLLFPSCCLPTGLRYGRVVLLKTITLHH